MLTVKTHEMFVPKVLRTETSNYFALCEAEIGCDIPEVVRPRRLPRPYVLIIDDSGLSKHLPLNMVGSILYGMDIHGHSIVGTGLILKEVMASDGPTLKSLEESDLPHIEAALNAIGFSMQREEEE